MKYFFSLIAETWPHGWRKLLKFSIIKKKVIHIFVRAVETSETPKKV